MGLFKRHKQPETFTEPSDVPSQPAEALPQPPAADTNGRRAVDEQVDYLLGLVEPLPAFGMYLLDAWGTAVCEDIVADTDAPADDLARVDGYAVRSSDLATKLAVQVIEGSSVTPGTAVKVSAGDRLPIGADAVIPASRAHIDDGTLTVSGLVHPGDQIRWSGCDVRSGTPLMRNGDRLDARKSALLALAGIDRVLSRPRPRVVVLSVGSGRSISEINSHMLAALVKSDGAQVWRVASGVCSDRELKDAVSDQLIRSDLVLLTGDLDPDGQILTVLPTMGLVDLCETALQPGGRIAFGLIGEDRIPTLVVDEDLLASYASYLIFARPMIKRLMGAPVTTPKLIECLAGDDLDSVHGLVDLRLATIRDQEGAPVAVPLGSADTPKLDDLVSANAVIVLDPEVTHCGLGETVGCWMLDD